MQLDSANLRTANAAVKAFSNVFNILDSLRLEINPMIPYVNTLMLDMRSDEPAFVRGSNLIVNPKLLDEVSIGKYIFKVVSLHLTGFYEDNEPPVTALKNAVVAKYQVKVS